MREHRMSYRLSTGPPKAKDDLAPDEGLTDHLIIVSMIGTPGQPEPLSLMPVLLGPNGAEPLTSTMVFVVATTLLAGLERSDAVIAPRFRTALAEALACLRRPVLDDR